MLGAKMSFLAGADALVGRIVVGRLGRADAFVGRAAARLAGREPAALIVAVQLIVVIFTPIRVERLRRELGTVTGNLHPVDDEADERGDAEEPADVRDRPGE